MKITGITLIFIGVLMTIFTSIRYFTKEKVIDVGKIEISKEQPHHILWSPLAGIIVLGAGVIFLWQSSKK